MPEQTLVLVKPDAVERKLAGEIIRRFETKGLRIAGVKMLRFDADLARRHYADHVDKDFYPKVEDFITSGPCIALVLEGNDAIDLVRKMMGATSPLDAAPGTVRGEFATDTTRNLVHGSDSPASAEREIPLFFADGELH